MRKDTIKALQVLHDALALEIRTANEDPDLSAAEVAVFLRRVIQALLNEARDQ